jgi:hypothetical protein
MAWTLIDSLNAPTSGVFDFPSLTLTGYKVLRVELSGITVTTDGTDVRLTFYVGGVEITAGYSWIVRSISTSATANPDSATGAASMLLVGNDANWDVGNASTEALGGVVSVDSPVSTALYKRASFQIYAVGPTGNAPTTMGVGQMDNAGAITGLKIGGTSNLTAGKVRVLGYT